MRQDSSCRIGFPIRRERLARYYLRIVSDLNGTRFFSERKVTLEKGQAKRDNEAIVRSPPIAETRTRLHALRVDSATAGGEGLRRDEVASLLVCHVYGRSYCRIPHPQRTAVITSAFHSH